MTREPRERGPEFPESIGCAGSIRVPRSSLARGLLFGPAPDPGVPVMPAASRRVGVSFELQTLRSWPWEGARLDAPRRRRGKTG